MKTVFSLLASGALLASVSTPLAAQDGSDLAAQISNPVSNLVSVPFQYNYDSGFLGGSANRSTLNIQPVIPISLGDDWNLISRTIIPVIEQDGFRAGGSQSGFGNTVQSFFFSPKEPTAGGMIWGAGPVVVIPTNTNGLGTDQWALGVTGVALRQSNGWTYGALANHVWSVTNNSTYGDQSLTYLQPFVSYSTPSATSFSINTESSYDWNTHEWSVPINMTVGKIVQIGGHPVQLAGSVRYWADSPAGGPEDWAARLTVTYLFPR